MPRTLALGLSLPLLLSLVHCAAAQSPTASTAAADRSPARTLGSNAGPASGPGAAPASTSDPAPPPAPGPATGSAPATDPDPAPATAPDRTPASGGAPAPAPDGKPARCAAPARPAQGFTDCARQEVFAGGCCYPSFEAACAGLGCSPPACVRLKSIPLQAQCAG